MGIRATRCEIPCPDLLAHRVVVENLEVTDLSEFLLGLGVDLASGAIVDLGRALMSRVQPEQQRLLRRTLADAVAKASANASASGAPAEAFLDVVARDEVLDAVAALSLVSSPERGVEPELARLLEDVDWETAGVDRERFIDELVPAARQVVMSVGRSGGPLAALALNLRMDDLQQRVGATPSRMPSEQQLPRLPPPIPDLLDQLVTVGDPTVEQIWNWLSRFDPVSDRRPVSSLLAEPPEWLTKASARIWRLLGQVAQAYDDLDAAVSSYLAAAERGASDASRLRARAAYLMFALGRDNSDLLTMLREPAKTDVLVRGATHAAVGDWAAVLEVDASRAGTQEEIQYLQMLQVVALVHMGDWREARARAMALHEESPSAPGIAILAAKTLLGEVEALEGEQQRREGLATALQLAIRARDSRRSWRGTSEEAVEVAAQAAVLLHDYDLALRLCVPPPDGDALSREASAPDVRATAAVLAAMSGRISLAKDLANGVSGVNRDLALAAIAEGERRPADAARHARDVLAGTTDTTKRQQAALVLAGVGALEPEDVIDLDGRDAVLLKAINMAETGRLEDAYEFLRQHGDADNARFVQLNALVLSRAGQLDMAADRLEEAASRFGDAAFRVTAARYRAQSGDWERASTLALEASAELDRSSPSWADAQRLLIEVNARRGDWRALERVARTLLGEDPTEESARWALALALINRRRAEEAWGALKAGGVIPEPATSWQAHLLAELLASFQPTADSARQLLDLADRFNEDERLRAQVIIALARMPGAALESDQALIERAQHHAADFIDKFPTSPYLTSIETTDEDEFTRRLEALLRPAAERFQNAANAVAHGAPAGLLAAAAGRPYAAIWPHRAPGHLPLTATDVRQSDASDWVARSAQVVVDASAIHTLALVPELWPHVRAATKELVTTDDAADDLLRSREMFSIESAGSLSWDLDANRPSLTDADESIRSLLEERASEMAHSLRWIRVVPWRTFQRFPEFDQAAFRPWIGLVDYCAATGTSFYCDDVGLRRFARANGVAAFDTTALVDGLSDSGRISADETKRIYIRLASEFAVDLPQSRQLLRSLIERDGFESLPAAYLLSRPVHWSQDYSQSLNEVRSLLRQVAAVDYELLPRWAAMAALGLARASGAIKAGLALIVEQVLNASTAGMRASLFFAARSVAAELGGVDPVPALVEILLDVMAGAVPPEERARLVLALFSEVPDTDRRDVVAALLKSASAPPRGAAGPRASEDVSTVRAQAKEARSRLARDLFGPQQRAGM